MKTNTKLDPLDSLESRAAEVEKETARKIYQEKEDWLKNPPPECGPSLLVIAEEAKKNLPAIQAAITKHGPFFERIGRLQFGLLPGATGIHQDEVRRRLREWQFYASAPRQLEDGFHRLEDLKVRIHQSPEAWGKRHKEYCKVVECFGMRHAGVVTQIETLRAGIEAQLNDIEVRAQRLKERAGEPTIKISNAAPVPVTTRASGPKVESEFTPR